MQSAQLNRKAHHLIRNGTVTSDLRQLTTEQILTTASNLDQMSALEIAHLMNDEDATVAAAVPLMSLPMASAMADA
jgi:N-acetylmuramic acid 6-phosphate (MurNAc-6-P) etherase